MQNKILLFFALTVLMSCGHPAAIDTQMSAEWTQEQCDSSRFAQTHHYTTGSNFVVESDTLILISQQPEEEISGLVTDSFAVNRSTRVVVAEIRTISNDPIDSIWLKLGTEDLRFGWTREATLLKQTVPDDPISVLIKTFSDVHVAIAAVLLLLLVCGLLITALMKRQAYMVHMRDIRSFYPTLLCIMVSLGAMVYATIQNFAADAWQDFYFHPTLNPLNVEPLLALFLIIFWAIQIVGLAVIDEVRRSLYLADALLYLLALGAVCAVDYIVFSISTLYYIGYLLVAVYIIVAVWQYLKQGKATWICGNCGATMAKKGRCPRCGAINQ